MLEKNNKEIENKDGYILGIDLGTTNSAAAVYHNDEIKVIKSSDNKMSDSVEKMFPSIVYINKKSHEILVGIEAKKKYVSNPQNTVLEIKRKMGTKETVEIDGYKYTPEQISSYILKKIKTESEKFLNEKEITDAIITVPAYFNDAQRQSTIDAGRLAGLNVIRIVNEPTAACLAYGLDKITHKDKMNIMVFTFGGGTHDVTTMLLENDKFKVIATSGDTHTGGTDIDQVIVDRLKELIKEKYNKEVDDPSVEARLKLAAEEAKIHLSYHLAADIEMGSIFPDDNSTFEYTLSQEELEQLSMSVVKRVEGTIKTVLFDSRLGAKDIDKLILIGGQTRMPLVRRTVEDYMQTAAEEGLDPMSCVANGAAINAAILQGKISYEMVDVTPLTLGVGTAPGTVQRLIRRNSPIPISRKQIFTTSKDNQKSVAVKIVQGERIMTDDNTLIGNFTLSGIPERERGVPQIMVNFDIDENGVLNVSARETSSGASKEITIKNRLDVKETSVQEAMEDADRYSYDDSKKKNTIELLKTADMAVYRGHKIQKQLIIPKMDVRKLNEKMVEVKKLTKMEIIENDDKKFDELRRLIIDINDIVDQLKEIYSVTEGL
ncbi:MAG TPA: molecular chaperone DnaK [Nitrososphaerales archaeon]|nr:molecular chaperone DnaK [Nitrososphaerales archaeon]